MTARAKPILVKVSGTVLPSGATACSQQQHARTQQVVDQFVALAKLTPMAIVIGGGNLFRGAALTEALGMRRTTADALGMLATVSNALMLADLLEQRGLACAVLSAMPVPLLAHVPSDRYIQRLMSEEKTIIFAGGLGTPFFSTDTCAVVRALQIEASQVWKATNVDGIYSDDPAKNKDAQRLATVSYEQVLTQKLGIMDAAAVAMALQYQLPIRVFDVFAPDALVNAFHNQKSGSTICGA